MLKSHKQRLRGTSSQSARPNWRSGIFRRLLAETLERRLPLAGITGGTGIFEDTGQRFGEFNTWDVAVGDLDNDGDLDAFVANRDDLGSKPSKVWLNDGQGTFADSGQNLYASDSHAVDLGDLDGDGDLDAFLGTYAGNLVLLNDGQGNFSDSGQQLGNSNDEEVKLADLDGDGDLDVFVATRSANQVWLNNGGAEFSDSGQTLGSSWSLDVELGDLDNDGDVDAYVSNLHDSSNRVWLNDGGGQFSDSGQDLGTGYSQGVSLGDLDGDLDLDVFVAGWFNGGGPPEPDEVWLNDGQGNFEDSGQRLGDTLSRNAVLGDLDDDGDLDAIVTTSLGYASKVWLNDGGIFSESNHSLQGPHHSTRAVALGDFDGNGGLDVFFGNRGCGIPERDCRDDVWLNRDRDEIIGHLFHDVNEDTLDNDDGADLEGRQVFLDMNGNGVLDDGEISTTTGPGGDFAFLNVSAGQYAISQVLPPGWTQAFPTGTPLVVTKTDDALIEVSFGNFNPAFNTATYVSEDAPKAIQGKKGNTFGVTTSTLTIASTPGRVGDLNVELDFNHTDPRDLTVYLYSPARTRVLLFANEGLGSGLSDTILDDEAEKVVWAGASKIPFTGRFQPFGSLSDFDGAAMEGTWTLEITDPERSNTGTLNSWSLTILAKSSENSVPAAVDDSDSTNQGVSVTTNVLENDALGDEPTQITGVTNPSAEGGLVAFDAVAGTTTYTPPNASFVGSDSYSYTIADADGETSTALVTVTVTATSTTTVTSISPPTMSINDAVPVTIVGAGFDAGADVTFVGSRAPQASDVLVVDTNTITAMVSSHKKFGGVFTVLVTNPDGSSDELTDGFTVTTPAATSFVPMNSGFVARFNRELDPSTLNLHDMQSAGPPDVVVRGANNGLVAGSLVVDPSRESIAFVKSGGALEPDTYTVTLRSAEDGFKDVAGNLLDGDGDGVAEDDLSRSFTISEPAANAITIGIPDFVRGPGEQVNLPASNNLGIPATISNGANVRAIDLRIGYDPTLLTVTGATVGADAPSGASVVVNTNTPGLAIVVFFSANALPAGHNTFLNVQATVPESTLSSGAYGSQQVIDVHGVTISDGNDNEFPVVVDDAVHLVSYFADVSGNGRINASDAARVARVAALLDDGFTATALTDPRIVGDISGNGRINAADASLVARFAALIDVPEIPPIPSAAAAGSADSGWFGNIFLPDGPRDTQDRTETNLEERSTSLNAWDRFPNHLGAVDALIEDRRESSVGAAGAEEALVFEKALDELFAGLDKHELLSG